MRIAGFTALDASRPSGSRWHQIALTGSDASTTETTWPEPSGDVVLAAVACLGGDGPTGVIDAEALHRADPRDPSPARLSAGELGEAERSACQYPSNG